jgi:23S rRNA (guanine745-N1)-methyltransferase
MPFADGCFDTVYNVFSPLALDEVRRVLKKRGSFIMVIPDEMHLFELKEKIYDNPYKNKLEEKEIDGFELVSDEPIGYKMELSTAEEVYTLFKMTPYAYRTRAEDAEKILKLDRLEVSANFRILTYKRG